jgi:hypothetical protein
MQMLLKIQFQGWRLMIMRVLIRLKKQSFADSFKSLMRNCVIACINRKSIFSEIIAIEHYTVDTNIECAVLMIGEKPARKVKRRSRLRHCCCSNSSSSSSRSQRII